MFGSVRLVFETILENLRKSSESGRKSSENHQKRRYQYVYIIKRPLHVSSKILILCYSWQEQYLTRSLPSLVRYCSCHSNIKFISSRHRVISSMYMYRKKRLCLQDVKTITSNTFCSACHPIFGRRGGRGAGIAQWREHPSFTTEARVPAFTLMWVIVPASKVFLRVLRFSSLPTSFPGPFPREKALGTRLPPS